MKKNNLVAVITMIVGFLVVQGCGGGSQSSALNLSGQWQFATSGGTGGTVSLSQQGAQITGNLSAVNYTNTAITGTLNGATFQATITGTYGPYACGAGVININVAIDLTGTVAAGGNSIAGQFVTQPTTCFNGNSGNWSATKS